MIVHIDGEINRYYVQSLLMVFFPGSTFGENEEQREGVPEAWVNVYADHEGAYTSYVRIRLNDRVCEATETVSDKEEISIATHESLAVGRAIFAAGKELLGYIPPWGILTGIRPAKMAGVLLAQGKGILRSKRILRDEYFLSPQKAALAVSVASTENKILKKIPKNACSVYISIPFCPSRCSYCSFVSYTNAKLLSLIEEYLEAICEDIDHTFSVISELGMQVLTVYIGGGTPTILSVSQMQKLLSRIKSNIDTDSLMEFTLEAGRPDTITKEKLAVAKEYGVTRISVNPQTLNDGILKEIGRRHTVEDFYNAFEIAKESGIRDINVDLIAGLPGDDFKNFSETMDKIVDLAPSNITIHTFCVKKAAEVLKKNSDVYSLTGGDASKSVFYSQLKAKFSGYKPYYMYRQKNTVGNLENVGFSLEGHEGLYNIFMMEEIQPIFAIGAGAVTKLVRKTEADRGGTRIERIFRPKYPYEFLRDARKAEGNETDGGREAYRQKILEFYGITDK